MKVDADSHSLASIEVDANELAKKQRYKSPRTISVHFQWTLMVFSKNKKINIYLKIKKWYIYIKKKTVKKYIFKKS
jgi:hypothetical protein